MNEASGWAFICESAEDPLWKLRLTSAAAHHTSWACSLALLSPATLRKGEHDTLQRLAPSLTPTNYEFSIDTVGGASSGSHSASPRPMSFSSCSSSRKPNIIVKDQPVPLRMLANNLRLTRRMSRTALSTTNSPSALQPRKPASHHSWGGDLQRNTNSSSSSDLIIGGKAFWFATSSPPFTCSSFPLFSGLASTLPALPTCYCSGT
jgi:hypothetical protein